MCPLSFHFASWHFISHMRNFTLCCMSRSLIEYSERERERKMGKKLNPIIVQNTFDINKVSNSPTASKLLIDVGRRRWRQRWVWPWPFHWVVLRHVVMRRVLVVASVTVPVGQQQSLMLPWHDWRGGRCDGRRCARERRWCRRGYQIQANVRQAELSLLTLEADAEIMIFELIVELIL